MPCRPTSKTSAIRKSSSSKLQKSVHCKLDDGSATEGNLDQAIRTMISWQNTAKAPSELTMTLVSLDKAPPFYLEKYVSNVSRRLDYRGTVLARPGVETEAEGGGLGADWKVPTYMLEVLYDMSTGVHRSVPLGKVSQEGILCLKAMYNEVTDSNLGKIVAVRMSLTRRYESWVTAADLKKIKENSVFAVHALGRYDAGYSISHMSSTSALKQQFSRMENHEWRPLCSLLIRRSDLSDQVASDLYKSLHASWYVDTESRRNADDDHPLEVEVWTVSSYLSGACSVRHMDLVSRVYLMTIDGAEQSVAGLGETMSGAADTVAIRVRPAGFRDNVESDRN